MNDPKKTQEEIKQEEALDPKETQDVSETETEEKDQKSKKEKKKDKKDKKDQEIEALKLEVDAMKEKMLRNDAELQNFKRRMNEERIKERKFANAEFAKSLLPVLDNFEHALKNEEGASNLEGFEMIYRNLKSALKENGLEEIEALDKPFDPNYHQAVMKEAAEDKESNTVIEVFQKGYMFKDRLLRPAMVKVSE